mmetsp:Transcript_3371/g.7999  ORF Transcript_3371/g.7999 Transcript_3371/m.7999 type:complete len:271 (-) Transcript_3371:911-1723(-)
MLAGQSCQSCWGKSRRCGNRGSVRRAHRASSRAPSLRLLLQFRPSLEHELDDRALSCSLRSISLCCEFHPRAAAAFDVGVRRDRVVAACIVLDQDFVLVVFLVHDALRHNASVPDRDDHGDDANNGSDKLERASAFSSELCRHGQRISNCQVKEGVPNHAKLEDPDEVEEGALREGKEIGVSAVRHRDKAHQQVDLCSLLPVPSHVVHNRSPQAVLLGVLVHALLQKHASNNVDESRRYRNGGELHWEPPSQAPDVPNRNAERAIRHENR